MKVLGLYDRLFIVTDASDRKAFKDQLRADNLERVYMISIIGLFLLLFLLVLDYLRYAGGTMPGNRVFELLFYNHLALAVLIIPIILIIRNREVIKKGQFKYSRTLIYSTVIYIGLLLLTMAILSIIDRNSVMIYVLFVLSTNFVIIFPHKERALFNLLSLVIISLGIWIICTRQDRGITLMYANILECASVTVLAFGLSTFLYNNEVKRFKFEKTLASKNALIEKLILNILPLEIARELTRHGAAKAQNYELVTVLFTDFKDFTRHSERLSPEALVAEIDFCFKAFDHIMEKFGVEKIKTIGDSYMAAAGLPTPNTSHPADAVRAALTIRDFMQHHNQLRATEGQPPFEIRVGVHSGPVVAGVVGVKKFAYDIWGDTVNLASRMESSGEEGKVNISHSTYELIKELPGFRFEARGKIQAKNKGMVEMYFVERKSK